MCVHSYMFLSHLPKVWHGALHTVGCQETFWETVRKIPIVSFLFTKIPASFSLWSYREHGSSLRKETFSHFLISVFNLIFSSLYTSQVFSVAHVKVNRKCHCMISPIYCPLFSDLFYPFINGTLKPFFPPQVCSFRNNTIPNTRRSQFCHFSNSMPAALGATSWPTSSPITHLLL